MGNCQAIDTATLAIEHPNGKVDKMLIPVPASQIMKMNPGYYVALLITTTICHTSTKQGLHHNNTLRITRVKLLRPTDSLLLGHVYRLISSQEVMKGLVAKKQAKMMKNGIELEDSDGLKEADKFAKTSHKEKAHQGIRYGNRSRTKSAANRGTTRPKPWQPSLNSISEATS
ncbi:unnamed protein product [Amaranthus hypochondriacus]